MHGSKRSNFRKRIFQLKIQLFVLTEDLAKQFVLVAQRILKLSNPQGKSLEVKIITYIEDLFMRQRSVKSPCLRLTFSSSFELEESSLEKSKSLKAAHAQDMIF
jgi:hypothetical protein